MKQTKTIDVFKSIYKPYRISKAGKTTILETTSGKFLAKEKDNSDIKNLYTYLTSRNFDNFPALIDGERDELNVFEYIDDIPTPKEQKAMDVVNLVSNLHNKTTYFKEVSEDRYKEIYEDVSNNIEYLTMYYNNLFDGIVTEVYMSPANYLLIRNSSKILAALEFSKKELDIWYAMVKEKKKQRVSLIHNNLTIDHLIKNQKDYLISWEKSKIDNPVLDIINFYKNEFFEIDFESLLNNYLTKYPLSDDEKKLLFIIISIPMEVNLTESEFENTVIIRKMLDYLYKTEDLIRPYYTSDEKEK